MTEGHSPAPPEGVKEFVGEGKCRLSQIVPPFPRGDLEFLHLIPTDGQDAHAT